MSDAAVINIRAAHMHRWRAAENELLDAAEYQALVRFMMK